MTDGVGDGDRIRELDATTIERIAAGEVVERPASVAKELVENSLDADASRIDVTVEAGGGSLVRVADDGIGMTEADVRTAVREHTTSKIRDVDDLAAGVTTLGFRGEALHTIGAVSRLTVTTRPREAVADADRGTELRVEGGDVVDVGPAGRPPGTTVTVRDLFYNTPAREKYLSRESTEFAHVNRVVTRYALANPDVAVSLTHGDREVFATTGRGDLREALLAVYGREVAAAMIELDAEADGPLDRVWGYVSDPETTRSTREYLSTYVNGRYVSDATVREGVLDGYGTQLAADRYPFVVLFLELPGESVDVNVHPRKMQVRFGDEDGVRRAVERAVRTTLLEEGLVRAGAPRGRSAPEDADVRPGGGESADGTDSAGEGSRSAGPTDDPSSGGAAGTPARDSSDADGERSPSGASEPAGASGVPDHPSSTDAGTDGASEPVPESALDESVATPDAPAGGSADAGSVADSPASPDADPDRKFRPATANASLPGVADDGDATDFDRLPRLRVLGQFDDTYVVAAADDGLVVIDQHAADERINYERLCERLAGRTERQRLVSPVELELTAGEAAAFEAALPALREAGFEATLGGDRTARVAAVPAAFSDALEPGLLRDVLAEFLADRAGDGAVESAIDDLLADLACYPSVTGNTSLSDGSIVDLLARLDDCENPFACPHGRPVVVEVSGDELADRFERDYPGHRSRRPEE